MTWDFKEIGGGGTNYGPIQEQFFDPDSISKPGKAVIREGIQNAMDASIEKKSKVTVRIGIVTQKAGDFDDIFSDIWWEHIEAKGNGINNVKPSREKDAKMLIFEDFGTTGLDGKVEDGTSRQGVPNNFYDFFRAVGKSDKGSGSRGKWGLGKHTFWMSSQLYTAFGFTVSGDKKDKGIMVMGKTILKPHTTLGHGESEDHADGFYGLLESPESRITLPITGERALDLAKRFYLHRTDQQGLSIVVPWLREDIKIREIENMIIEEYFYPIFSGQLEVIVRKSAETEFPINDQTIKKYLGGVSPREAQLINLGSDLIEQAGNIKEVNPATPDKPEWDELIFGEDLKSLSDSYREGEPIFLRINIALNILGKSKPTYFDVALQQYSGEERGACTCVRSGIVVKEAIRTKQSPLAILVAEEKEIDDFLGASENPAHTEWRVSILEKKRIYKDAGDILKFVRQAPIKIVEILTAGNRETNKSILSDIFPRKKKPGLGKEKKKRKGVKPPIPKPKRCIIEQRKGGFKVRKGDADIPPGAILEVKTAYDTFRGNPFDRYKQFDFSLEKLDIEYHNLNIIDRKENLIRAEVISSDFTLEVQGFDEKRDLRIYAEINTSFEAES